MDRVWRVLLSRRVCARASQGREHVAQCDACTLVRWTVAMMPVFVGLLSFAAGVVVGVVALIIFGARAGRAADGHIERHLDEYHRKP